MTKTTKLDYLCIIQARLESTRFPNKVMQTVGGTPMVKRIWEAAKSSWADKVVVAWPERYYYVNASDVRERFRLLALEFPSNYIIRLTSDCPLLSREDINRAINKFRTELNREGIPYYSNHYDGHDVQIFTRDYLFRSDVTDTEHVIADFTTPSTGLSVNTKEDLERVRKICATK
jgi:glutamate-1-semialdehyde 2,1-aminomutase